jgi:hypothetical protein
MSKLYTDWVYSSDNAYRLFSIEGQHLASIYSDFSYAIWIPRNSSPMPLFSNNTDEIKLHIKSELTKLGYEQLPDKLRIII